MDLLEMFVRASYALVRQEQPVAVLSGIAILVSSYSVVDSKSLRTESKFYKRMRQETILLQSQSKISMSHSREVLGILYKVSQELDRRIRLLFISNEHVVETKVSSLCRFAPDGFARLVALPSIILQLYREGIIELQHLEHWAPRYIRYGLDTMLDYSSSRIAVDVPLSSVPDLEARSTDG